MHKLLRTTILITFGIFIIGIINGCGDNPPEEVTDPRQSGDDVRPPSATEVVMDPPPRTNAGRVLYVPPHTEFALTFNEGVVAVTVNDTPATGSGLNWKWSAQPALPEESVMLHIEWKNRDGSKGSKTVGPYEIRHAHVVHPTITSGTVADGAADVDPAPINAGGLRFDFDEPVTGTIKLTDEAGVDLNWVATVDGQTATLTAVAGQEMVNETTYKVEIDVRDGADLPLQVTITFVTKPK